MQVARYPPMLYASGLGCNPHSTIPRMVYCRTKGLQCHELNCKDFEVSLNFPSASLFSLYRTDVQPPSNKKCSIGYKHLEYLGTHQSSSSTAAAAAVQQAETWSIIQEAARQWIATCTDQERGWVPRRGRENWLGLIWEVESLRRRGAVFGRSHEDITLSEGGLVATSNTNDETFWTAASKAVMRAGRHYAQFTMVRGTIVYFGVIRPGWDVEGGDDAYMVHGHCFYHTSGGSCCPGYHGWDGMQATREQGDRIGLLLDLDQGSMTVYKNDERLGVMATGLSGEYSWAVSLHYVGYSARVDAAALPAPGPEI